MLKLAWIKLPIYRELYAVCLSYQINVIYGITLAYSSYLLPQLWEGNYGFEVTKQSAQLIGDSGIMLRPIGVIVNIFIADKFGRMTSLRLTFLLLIFSWISVATAWNIGVLIIARMINGLICGAMVSGSVYIYEIAVGKMAAMYISLLPACMTIGGSLVSLIMYFADWRTTGWILAVHSMVTFLCLCTLPESPYWYVMRGRKENAEQSLRWFGRLNDQKLRDHLNYIETSVENTKPSMRQKLQCALQPSVRNNFIVFFLLSILDRISGYLVINNFSVEFFSHMQTVFDSGKFAIAYGLICFLSSLSLCWLVYLIDLRRLMIYSSLGMIVSSLLAAGFYAASVDLSTMFVVGNGSNIALQIGLLISVVVYTIFLYGANGEGIWILAVQVFPTIVLSSLYGILEITDMLVAAIVSYFVPPIIYNRDYVYLFLTFAGSAALILRLVFCIPADILSSRK